MIIDGVLYGVYNNLLVGITNGKAHVYLPTFATGGLANFTGPAWLDGTSSSPELVLNAKDTENFLVLRDILSRILTSSSSQSGGGDNYYNFDIKVDELANDYDVEQLADKIKRMINQDARYRNVNSINFLR